MHLTFDFLFSPHVGENKAKSSKTSSKESGTQAVQIHYRRNALVRLQTKDSKNRPCWMTEHASAAWDIPFLVTVLFSGLWNLATNPCKGRQTQHSLKRSLEFYPTECKFKVFIAAECNIPNCLGLLGKRTGNRTTQLYLLIICSKQISLTKII